jgi:predicted hydrolase (HD superfamily)
MDLEVSSVKKKFKTPKFAAGCSRDVGRVEVVRRKALKTGLSQKILMRT